MRILVAGATGSIGIHVVNTAIAMGHQPVTLVRNRRKIKLLPRGTDIFYGDVSIPETLTDLPKDIDAIIFTLGSDGQGRIGARAIDYGGVRNILRIFMDTPVRIALMTTIGVTERLSSWNQRTEVHDWKRRSERLVRASGHIYTIVRPGWFDYNNDDEHRIVMLQGDRRHAGTPEDGVISREQIAQVLVTALSNDAAKNKTFELVAERGEARTPKFVQASLMHGLKGNWTPYGGMQIAEDYQAFNLGIGKDLGLFGAFSFDITQANTTLADDTRHSGQSVKFVYSKSFYQTGTNIQVAGYRYSTQGFYNLSDSAYSRMSGYTVKPPTGDTSEQTLFIDYFNLFYSKRGQEQISISQQLGNYGTTFFSASRQSYWNTSRSDQQISFGLNVPFGDITTSLNYSYSNNIWQNDRDHLLAFTLNVPFSHWMRTDSQSAFHNSNASYSMSNDLKGGMTNLSGVYGTLLPDNNLNYSVQVGNTQGGNTSSGTSGYSSLNYRGAYGNTNVGYSRSGDSSQIYYGMSGGIIAHADGITFGQPLGDTMVLVKAPGADNVKIENQTGIHTDWRGYAILPFATEYRENRVALNANSLADNVELDETVVTVIPTHGAIARATFNAQIGGKVLMTLKYGNKSVPFGAIVTHGENKNGSIVAENGQVYLTGLPQSGKLQVSWGKDKNSNCIVDYKLPVVSPGTLLNQQTAICR